LNAAIGFAGRFIVQPRVILRDLGWIIVASAAVGYATARGAGVAGDDGGGGGGRTRAAGSGARAPQEIPAAGWLNIAKRTYGEIGRDRVLAVAAGVTFYAILALVPALTALVSLYGLVADQATIIVHMAALDGLLPAGAADLLRDQVTRIAAGGEAKLGFAFAAGVALALWSANAGVKAIFDALNVAYGEEEKRGFIWLNFVSLTFTLATILFVLLAIGATTIIPVVLDVIPLGPAAGRLLTFGRWPALIAALMLGLSLLYRFGPSRNEAKWSWVSPGAVLASIGWLVASLLFSWYVANFEDYNETYGALGAIVGLLTWLWLSTTIVLIGAEFNSETERQTLADTTAGPSKPMGLRGADAADRKAA